MANKRQPLMQRVVIHVGMVEESVWQGLKYIDISHVSVNHHLTQLRFIKGINKLILCGQRAQMGSLRISSCRHATNN